MTGQATVSGPSENRQDRPDYGDCKKQTAADEQSR
jgi:hypothetical protein